jgi:choline dehydrogenase
MAEFDYIIVGAGSAGCVLANRLTADPSVRVLLLEAGGSDRKMNIRIPIGFAKQFRTDLDWNYMSEPEDSLIGRSMYLPRGRSLGGSSSMNAMIYIRGHRSIYDSWADDHGATGWSYADVLPYFKRSEDNDRIRNEFHGQGGELNVVDANWTSTLAPRLVESAKSLGIAPNDDFNGPEQEGVGLFQLTQKRGRRWSSADAFLHPVEDRPNLTVITEATTRRVLLDGGRATGVEYEREGTPVIARAGREVVVCAGAFNSPQLLMLSGIGPADHLREHGIEPVVDSPHVGAHLQDHPLITTTWEVKDTKSLLDATKPQHLVHYLASRGKGMLSSNVAEAAAHVRIRDGIEAPDFQILLGAAYYFDNGFRTYPEPAFTLGPSFIGPTSEGEVRLRSADPHDKPVIRLGWFQDPEEMRSVVKAVRMCRELAEARPLADVVVTNIDPGPGVLSDEQIEAFVRATAQHTYHPSCTVRMGREDDGVLDPELRVRGVDGLRVADCSSMPRITSGNTNAPAIMIGEKAADMILGREPLPRAAVAVPAGAAA